MLSTSSSRRLLLQRCSYHARRKAQGLARSYLTNAGAAAGGAGAGAGANSGRQQHRTALGAALSTSLAAAALAATHLDNSESSGEDHGEGATYNGSTRNRIPFWNTTSATTRNSLQHLMYSASAAAAPGGAMATTATVSCEPPGRARSRIARRTTHKMDAQSTKRARLESKYDVDWKTVLGEGAYGSVYLATEKGGSRTKVAVKKIPLQAADDVSFQREMDALLLLEKSGGHPNICSLREHFHEGDHYYLVLDLIAGGEMFDHLVRSGPYSEADAARLIREAASALAYIHGLNVVHGDVKPENLMLSTEQASDAVVKLVDFGCAQVADEDSVFLSDDDVQGPGRTPAYCPPEVLDPRKNRNGTNKMEPTMDIWALGIVLYVMLVGVHPFDVDGRATDEEIEHKVVKGSTPPLRGSYLTEHLSKDAIDVIAKMLRNNPRRRITAIELLEHPWVKGETASSSLMKGSDEKLSQVRDFKTRIGAKVFADIMNWSEEADSCKKTSLIERSFREFDNKGKGHITMGDIQRFSSVDPKDRQGGGAKKGAIDPDQEPLSLSGFSKVLNENMRNRYLNKGDVVYKEGDKGNHMYIINSGIVEVKKGESIVDRGPGNFFGEGALFHPRGTRSATVRCKTPVHLLEISREYFDKYLAESDPNLLLTLREKDQIRKRNRARKVMRLQTNLKDRFFNKGEALFKEGDDGQSLFLVESGVVDVLTKNQNVFSATAGNVCGEHSVLMDKPRNTTALCASDTGCEAFEMSRDDFNRTMEKSPDLKGSVRTLCLRREFKKAVVFRLKRKFPYDDPRLAFDAAHKNQKSFVASWFKLDGSPIKARKKGKGNDLDFDDIACMMRDMDPNYTDEEVWEVIRAIQLRGESNTVSYEEFKKVFIADIKQSASM